MGGLWTAKEILQTSVTQFQTSAEVAEALDAVCFVEGLFLEVAGWDLDKGCLREQNPKVLTIPLPVMKMIPVLSETADIFCDADVCNKRKTTWNGWCRVHNRSTFDKKRTKQCLDTARSCTCSEPLAVDRPNLSFGRCI
jgi:hypothetical protein